MPNDATLELLAGLQKKVSANIYLIGRSEFNIDDMDSRFSMVDLKYTGCYCIASSKSIDPKRPGMVYVNGKPTESPLVLPPGPMFAQMIGIHCRRWLKKYDALYHIRYAEAYDLDGLPVPEYSFELKTKKRIAPGELFPEHDQIVLDAAREGTVLLKNDNQALPLGAGATVNVFGAAATVFRSGCLGAGKINPRYCIRVKEGIEKYSSLNLNDELYEIYTSELDVLPDKQILEHAKTMNDVAVIFLSRNSSEAHDGQPVAGSYYLTTAERELLEALSKFFGKSVVVLNVAHPIETGWIEEFGIDAVLLTGLSGMAGGRALAEILEGRECPSGKLANTWAMDYWDYPSSVNFHHLPSAWKLREEKNINFLTTVYEEGLYVGYRYFLTFNKKAAFLFGHGLSYTSFAKTLLHMNVSELNTEIAVQVANTGKFSGKEVVQVYAQIPGGKLEQPSRRLVAFAKTRVLSPGEKQVLTLSVTKNRLKSYDQETASWIIEAGIIELYLGDAPNKAVAIGVIEVAARIVIAKAKNRIPCPYEFTELSKHDHDKSFPEGKLSKIHTGPDLPYQASRDHYICKEAALKAPDRLITFPEVLDDAALLTAFVGQMTDYELARISVGERTGWGADDTGFAGKLYNVGDLKKYDIPDYFFADGNNGCNMFAPNIGFPVSSTVSASWNAELSFAEGAAIATEAKAMNINCLLAPALNLQRDPLCGRHTEYFSEDPFLAGRMAGQESLGIESHGVSSCMKHFFANNAETFRSANHSLMTERTARELYIGAFEAAFEVNPPDTVMTGYNAANGSYCADDPALLHGILSEEMGFAGFVMTDWNGYGNKGLPELIKAGINWIAPGSPDDSMVKPLVEALSNGELSRAELQQSVLKLLRVIRKNIVRK